jgi:SlyX protein
MTENAIIELEIKIAYQEDLLQTLNDIVAKQQLRLDALEYAYKSMSEKVASLALKQPEESAPQYEIPPHY